jgi:hypothetical protein
MSATYTIDSQTGRAIFYVSRLLAPVGTFHSDYITLHTSAVVAEADITVRDALMRHYHAVLQKSDDLEEQEWHRIVNQPRVRRGLRRLADEVRQQIAAGEIEEGGFAID